MMTPFEVERQNRIADNKRRMLELGIRGAAPAKKPVQKKEPIKKREAAPLKRRKSGILRSRVNYVEKRQPGEPVERSERSAALTESEVEEIMRLHGEGDPEVR